MWAWAVGARGHERAALRLSSLHPWPSRPPDSHRGQVWLWLWGYMLHGGAGCHTIQPRILRSSLRFLLLHSPGFLLACQGVRGTSRGGWIQRGWACRHGNLCTTHCTLKRGNEGAGG